MAKEVQTKILVGTYRPECLDWILKKHIYNLPVVKGVDGASLPKFHYVALIAKGQPIRAFVSHFCFVQSGAWLKQRKYPCSSTPHAERYAIYALDKEVDNVDKLMSGKGKALVVMTTSLPSCKLNEETYKNIPALRSKSTAFIIEQLRPYVVPTRASYIYNPIQTEFMKELGISKDIPFPNPKNPKFTFIDLFAGIGGFRLAMNACGGKCVFTSEFDGPAQQTYFANYGEMPKGDITQKRTKDAIPAKFDIVCAGFPCQAFSLAGKRMGFDDNFKGLCRGTLFKEVVEICEQHQPKAVFCENVKGLLIHDKGRTLQVIKGAFEEIGYQFDYHVLNSKDFGVPQNRERVYMIALRKDIVKKLKAHDTDWKFPFESILKEHKGKIKICLEDILEKKVSARYYLSDVYMETLRRHRARHEAAGHGFGYEIRDRKGISGAIVCGGMGRERNLVQEHDCKTPAGLIPETHIKGHINQEGIRKMTPKEWARLQGFPETFKFVLSDVHLYKQFGNSVSIPVIRAISKKIVEVLSEAKEIHRR